MVLKKGNNLVIGYLQLAYIVKPKTSSPYFSGPPGAGYIKVTVRVALFTTALCTDEKLLIFQVSEWFSA